jgi:cell division protease FtsH
MNINSRFAVTWVTSLILLITLDGVMEGLRQQRPADEISFSQLLTDVDQGHVWDVLIQGSHIRGTFSDGRTFQTYAPDYPTLIERLYGKGVTITAEPQGENAPGFASLIFLGLTFVAMMGAWLFAARAMQGPWSTLSGFGQSRAKLRTGDHGRVTFDDVAGVDAARSDLEEIVEFSREPAKFLQLGGRMPRGVLLVDSPGVGKTLIARAVAGEAGVPFFTISGSDFVEIIAGIGASRVRGMFEQAKKNTPASYSSTKSMRWPATAVPVSEAAMMSASRLAAEPKRQHRPRPVVGGRPEAPGRSEIC